MAGVRRPSRSPLVASLLGVVVLLALAACGSSYSKDTVPVSEVTRLAREGELARLVVRDDLLVAERRGGGPTLRAYLGSERDPYRLLATAGVSPDELARVEVVFEHPGNGYWSVVLWSALFSLYACLIASLAPRRLGGPEDEELAFRRSRARLYVADRPATTFDDVAGVDEAKEELQEVVGFLREPERFRELGARIPRGVLLVGPPGTGKTLLARALAGEARASFLSASASEFVEVFVGVGAARVRDLFERARRNSPCVVFVDELDAVGRCRGVGVGAGSQEREQTLNQLLVEMDGFGADSGVVVLAATNRPDVLDPALLRPGRFDRKVLLEYPDSLARLAILGVHARGRPLEPRVDLAALARSTAGLSGADLANLVNEAAILAARSGKRAIGQRELGDALDRVRFGPERHSRVVSPRERSLCAYHEVGHALVALQLGRLDPSFRLSTLPRGTGGELQWLLAREDRRVAERGELEDELAVALAGRAAEELAFGEQGVTTQAADDLRWASELARRMVARYGMGRELGPLAVGLGPGLEVGEEPQCSEAVAETVDREVSRLLEGAAARCREILTRCREGVVRAVRLLVERESLASGELARALADRQDSSSDGRGGSCPDLPSGGHGEENSPARSGSCDNGDSAGTSWRQDSVLGEVGESVRLGGPAWRIRRRKVRLPTGVSNRDRQSEDGRRLTQ